MRKSLTIASLHYDAGDTISVSLTGIESASRAATAPSCMCRILRLAAAAAPARLWEARRGAECQRACVCAINRHRRCSGCYRRKQRKQHRTLSSHASTAHLDATLAHSFSITAPCMHTHTQRGSTYRAPQPAHSFTITATRMHKHTQRGSTYKTPSTFRLPKLSGRVAG